LPARGGFDAFLQRGHFCVAPDQDWADNGLIEPSRHLTNLQVIFDKGALALVQ
jgi:hypothetical protein